MNPRSFLSSLLLTKCPRCRRGDMFTYKNPFRLQHLFGMPEHCPVCRQKYELEPGFWFGTGYVSYGLAIAFSIFNLIWYWLIFGISVKDNSIYSWLVVNAVILLIAMPWLIRLSRAIYLYLFVHYDPETEGIPGADSSASRPSAD
jgi:hypothetical protein